MRENLKAAKLQLAIEGGQKTAGRVIMELMLDADEDPHEIAVDFIENELGRLDWVGNWEVVKARQDPLARVQSYLNAYGLVADAQEIVNIIDKMVDTNPGRWK